MFMSFLARWARPGGQDLSEKVRELCKWKRDEYSRQLALLREVVRKPRHVCEKCGRAARKKTWLCKPVSLD